MDQIFEEIDQISCPECGSAILVKSGFSSKGKRVYQCKACGKYFSPGSWHITKEKREIASRLILEGVKSCIVARALEISPASISRLKAKLANEKAE